MSEDTSSGDDTDESEDTGSESSSGVTPEDRPDVKPEDVQEGIVKGRERLQEEADRAVEGFDEGVVDLLSWVLDTDTRARIYVYLRQHPGSTSEEVAEGTGLYPSTVREALAELADEETVTREKRESEGAGNNPYEYEAIAPSDLVSGVVNDVQKQLNTVFNLDSHLRGRGEIEIESEPIKISVEDESADLEATDEDDDSEAADEDDDSEAADEEEEDTSAGDADDDADDDDPEETDE